MRVVGSAVLLALLLAGCVSPPRTYDPREPGVQPEVGSVDWNKVGKSAAGIAGLALRLVIPIPIP